MRLVLPEADLKAVKTQTGTRVLDFYAATFSDEPDRHGHMIAPTAFDDWLGSFYAKGDSLPISFAHAAILNSTDAAQIIGYAPADPDHVWVDQFGLRVKALLYGDLETAKHVIRLIDDKVVKAASLAMQVEDFKALKGGNRLITKSSVREAGPAMFPVNEKAVLLALKSSLEAGWLSSEDFKELFGLELKAVDESAWDGNKAMGQCSTAADYRSICAGVHGAGEPGERQHYALPHHYLGKGPNADGVRAALSRLPQTEDLANATEARSHLEGHMSQINPQKAEELDDILVKSSPEYVQTTHDAAVRAGAVCEHEMKAEDPKDEPKEETNLTVVPDEPVEEVKPAEETKPDGDVEPTEETKPDEEPSEDDALNKAETVLEESSPLLTDEDREVQRRLRYIEITQT